MGDKLADFIQAHRASPLVGGLHERALVTHHHRIELYSALIEIASSVLKIYGETLVELQLRLDDGEDVESIKDVLFELRDEFRHITSHIEDARLTEIEWGPPEE